MITPNSAATPASAMKPTALATDRLCPSTHSSHTPPTSAKGSVAMISSASSRRRKVRYSSTKMISSVNGTTSFSWAVARSRNSNCPDQTDRIAGRQRHLLGHRALHVQHRAAQVAAADVDVHKAGQARVFAAQHRRPVADAQLGHVAQHQALAARRDDGQRAQAGHRIAQLARVAQVDRETLQALDRLADVHAAHGAGHHLLHVGDVQAVARRGVAADVHVDVAPAGQALGQGAGHAGHRLHRASRSRRSGGRWWPGRARPPSRPRGS